jgi:hypothetical protein
LLTSTVLVIVVINVMMKKKKNNHKEHAQHLKKNHLVLKEVVGPQDIGTAVNQVVHGVIILDGEMKPENVM